MDRRTLLGKGAAVVGGLLAGQMLQPEAEAQTRPASPAPAPRNSSAAPQADSNTLNLTVVGETMAVRPFSMQTDPDFLSIVKLIRESDLAYAHLEMNLASPNELGYAARGSSGGAGYLVADPVIARDLKWAGIDAMSVANNHSFDWGEKGLLATIRNCNRAGIAVAGTGANLEEAREPVYFEKDKGRIAMLAISSGNSAFEWAGLAKGATPGRPGINPIRVRTVYQVDHATAEQLKATGKNLGVLSDAAAAKKEFNITPGAISGSNGYSGFSFVDGDKFEITTENHPGDVAANLKSVEEAKAMADFVIVAQHMSISEARRGDTPVKAAVDFAHKTIDSGADIYIGHGWHTFLGIEVYKNKPIIYGLGNFFWQSAYIPRVPADEYESYGYSMDELVGLRPAVGSLHPEGDSNWAWSAVFQFKYENKKITAITLHPIEMGYDFTGDKPKPNRQVGSGDHPYLDGSPRMAHGANAQKILERAAKLCALRGTKVEIADGIGTIKIA
jgi:poly-gamma-glutamate synthesis protein (capsule biosynthesis protein)